ncbi:MAG: ATP-binding protein [bacterium]|nr:ATP-binding protein [bacterium]
MRSDATFLGLVRKVIGAKVFIEISSDIPSANPIIYGRVYRLGQVGSFIKIPMGGVYVYGIVSSVGAVEIKDSEEIADTIPSHGQRWMEVQLVGELHGQNDFRRGVTAFPTIDDEVHMVTHDDLERIYGQTSPSFIAVGSHAVSESLSATVDISKVVTRHACIVGSTGSGKSNTVTCLLRALTDSKFPSANIVIIDPHGEYRSALKDHALVYSIADVTNPLKVPYWALSYDELAWFLVDRRTASDTLQDATLRDRIIESKRQNCTTLKAGSVPPAEVSADSPIPFNLHKIWYDLYEAEYATLRDKDDWSTVAYKKDNSGRELKGNIEDAEAPQYEPPGTGSSSPFKSTRVNQMGSYLGKIQGRLRDPRFEVFFRPGSYDGTEKDLHDLLSSWVCHDRPMTVLDLGGVPFDVVDVVVGVVTRLLFESMFWGRDLPGIGRQRPLLMVYEEAHTYLNKGGTSQFIAGYASRAVRRVLKEGRKMGMGAVLVSQRPSELDDTILSQCGSFIALRLSNSDDQGRIRAALPDSLSGLVELLPALRTGEAIVLGEAVTIPSRIRFPLMEPRPTSDDPDPATRWLEDRVASPNYDKVVTYWRRQTNRDS